MSLNEIYIENILQPQADIIEENEPDIEAFELEAEQVHSDFIRDWQEKGMQIRINEHNRSDVNN